MFFCFVTTIFTFPSYESISQSRFLCYFVDLNKYLHTLFSLTNPLATICLSSLSLVLSFILVSWFALVCWWLYIGKYALDCLFWFWLVVLVLLLPSSNRLSFSKMAALCGISVMLNEVSCKFECGCCCSFNLVDVVVVSRTFKLLKKN